MDEPVRKRDIVAYLEEFHEVYVNAGKRYPKVRCINPDHDDRKPSASVDTERDSYHCFTCGLSGDVLDLVQELDGVDFLEAAERTAHLPSREPDESEHTGGKAKRTKKRAGRRKSGALKWRVVE